MCHVHISVLQEETVAELRTVEGEAASYLDQISRYSSNAFKVVILLTFELI